MNFFFGLLKSKPDLFFSERQEVLVDTVQNTVDICSGCWDSIMKSGFIGVCVDMWFLQEDQVDYFAEKLVIHCESFLSITGHSTDGIEDNGITCMNFSYEFVKFIEI